jgi:hypothetical protein
MRDDAKIGDVEVSWRSPGVAARGTLDARDLNDEAATPADSIDAAHCNDREFGTSRGQLATESYPDLRVTGRGMRFGLVGDRSSPAAVALNRGRSRRNGRLNPTTGAT